MTSKSKFISQIHLKGGENMKRNKGFTLIELMVVIAVIGILASVALVSLTGVQKSARDAQRKSDISTYRTAMERYYADLQVYPGSAGTGDSTSGAGAGIFTTAGELVSKSYMPKVLTDPQNAASNCKISTAAAAQACLYKYLSNATSNTGSSYVLWAIMENPTSNGGVYFIDAKGSAGLQTTEPTVAP